MRASVIVAMVVSLLVAAALIATYRSCRRLTAAGALVVVDDQRPDAFTTPQPAGRIVVTTGLLKALTSDERRVVLAHETSHLLHRHAWWLLVADLAAAANPLLRPTARAAARCVERWADEDAATTIGDRLLAARSLARVALLMVLSAATVMVQHRGEQLFEHAGRHPVAAARHTR